MAKRRSIFHVLSVLFVAIFMLTGVSPCLVAAADAAQAGPLSTGELAQIRAMLPASAAATTYTQQAYLKASTARAGDNLGTAISLDGNTLVVGAPYESSNATGVLYSGAAYVFTRTGGTWSQQAYLKASNAEAYDNFGETVSISGDTLVVGAHGEDSHATGVNGAGQADNSAEDSGAVYVFTRSGTNWSQQAYIKASNTDAGDNFGWVSLSGDTLVVGAHGEDSNGTGVNGLKQADNSASQAGASYVFTRSGSAWSQQAYLKASNTGGGDFFGSSLTLSGDTLGVGAIGESSHATGVNGDQGNNASYQSGATYVFTRTGYTWSQQAYLKASNTDAEDNFGFSTSLSGDTLVVGAIGEDSNGVGVNGNQTDNSYSNAGAVYVFTRNGISWSQKSYLKASNTDAYDRFGWAVSVSGDTLAAGAVGESSEATSVNGNQANNSALESGAGYVFGVSEITHLYLPLIRR